MSFAKLAFDFVEEEHILRSTLENSGLPECEYAYDSYNATLVLRTLDADFRLSGKLQRILYDNGFVFVRLIHKDQYDTFYKLAASPVKGWRRKKLRFRELRKGLSHYFWEISEWPESWNCMDEWEREGFKIVPDALQGITEGGKDE